MSSSRRNSLAYLSASRRAPRNTRLTGSVPSRNLVDSSNTENQLGREVASGRVAEYCRPPDGQYLVYVQAHDDPPILGHEERKTAITKALNVCTEDGNLLKRYGPDPHDVWSTGHCPPRCGNSPLPQVQSILPSCRVGQPADYWALSSSSGMVILCLRLREMLPKRISPRNVCPCVAIATRS